MKTYLFLLLFFLSEMSTLSARQIHFLNNGQTRWMDVGDLDISGNQITLEAFIYIEKEPDNWPESNIISKHGDPRDVNYLFRAYSFEITTYNSGNSGNTSFYKLSTNYTYELNKWYHCAATYDGSMMRYYVNGCQIAETPARGNLFQNSHHTAIGNRYVTSDEQFWGWMDEIRIWNQVRSEEEIQANMFELKNNENGLIGYWNFNDSSRRKNQTGRSEFDGQKGRNGGPLAYDDNPVTVFEKPDISIVDPTCFGGDDGSVSLLPEPNTTYSIDGMNLTGFPIFENLTAGDYLLHIKNNGWCIIEDSIELINPSIIQTVFREEICVGSSIDWMGNIYDTPGWYEEKLTATNGCDSLVVLNLNFKFLEFLGKDTFICSAEPFIIQPTKNDIDWLPPQPTNAITVSESGTYIAQYEDEDGCLLRDSISVEYVEPLQMYIPSAFSPNNDGINDDFQPYLPKGEEYWIKIMDRWGNFIYHSNAPWDGRFRGKMVPIGVYIYSIEVEKDFCGDLQIIQENGDVTVLR